MKSRRQLGHLAAPGLAGGVAGLGVLLVLSLWQTACAADDEKLKAYGRHLAQECTGCHRLDGVDNGIPSIVGWKADIFVATVKFYQQGTRTNPVMVSVANSLNEKQLDALAMYFGSLPKRARRPGPAADRKSIR
jgi:cytochrome c553